MRRAALALVLAIALGPVVGGLHATEERHVFCPEHGAFEDAPAAGRASTLATLAPGAPTKHLRCAFVPTSAPTAPSTLDLPDARAHAAPAPPPPARDLSTPPQIAILRHAPKGSPPTTA